MLNFYSLKTGTQLVLDPKYGIWALVIGTLKITVIATIVAVPIGLGAAIYLSEYASDKARRIIKPILEILAGIPTIVFGFFALTFVTPVLRTIIPALIVSTQSVQEL